MKERADPRWLGSRKTVGLSPRRPERTELSVIACDGRLIETRISDCEVRSAGKRNHEAKRTRDEWSCHVI